jgi:hypothetical protein
MDNPTVTVTCEHGHAQPGNPDFIKAPGKIAAGIGVCPHI